MAALHDREISPRLKQLGYSEIQVHAIFMMVTLRIFDSRWASTKEVMQKYPSGFMVDDLLPRLPNAAQRHTLPNDIDPGRAYAGFSWDDALGHERMRISMWLSLPEK